MNSPYKTAPEDIKYRSWWDDFKDFLKSLPADIKAMLNKPALKAITTMVVVPVLLCFLSYFVGWMVSPFVYMRGSTLEYISVGLILTILAGLLLFIFWAIASSIYWNLYDYFS